HYIPKGFYFTLPTGKYTYTYKTTPFKSDGTSGGWTRGKVLGGLCESPALRPWRRVGTAHVRRREGERFQSGRDFLHGVTPRPVRPLGIHGCGRFPSVLT